MWAGIAGIFTFGGIGGCASASSEREASPDAGIEGEPEPAPDPDAAPNLDLRCDDGFVNVEAPNGGNCFMLFDTAMIWQDADAACKALDGDTFLAVPGSAEENGVVDSVAGNREVWIGATDAGSENIWVWTNAEAFVYTNWRGGEPNNGNGNEDCMILEGNRGGSWDDRGCELSFAYVCERNR